MPKPPYVSHLGAFFNSINMKTFVKIMSLLLVATVMAGCGSKEQRFVPKSLADLRGHTVAANSGTTQEKIARMVTEKENVQCLPGGLDALIALDAGQCDVALVERNNMFSDDFMRLDIEEAFTDSTTQEPLACALRKEDSALLQEYTAFFDSIQACGRLDEIKSRWLNPLKTNNLEKVVIRQKDVPTKGKRVLRLGSDGSYPPYDIMVNNEMTGYEVELWQRFAIERGYGLVCEVYTFDALLPALQSKKIDVIAAGMSVTPDREKMVLFTPADDYSVTTVLIRKANAGNDKPFYEKLQESFDRSLIQQDRWKMIVEGFWTTIWIFLGSLIIGVILGAFISYLQMSRRKLLSVTANCYIDLMRNIPILVLLLVMYYIILANSGLSAMMVAIIASAMNFGAYIAVMFTTGIRAVDPGQTEAGLALGYTPLQTFVYIVAPQAARHIIPVFQGEAISLLKGTSIVGYISIVDLTKASDLIRNSSFEAFFPLIFVTIIYFVLAWMLSKSLDLLLKKISK